MASAYIQRHILRLPATRIFTTRELLQYGSRGAVDQTLYRLVLAKSIIRLARGVFVRDDSLNPSQETILLAKAAAWGKTVFRHAQKILAPLGLADLSAKQKSTFAINAHSSSFDTRQGRVYVHGIGTRRVKLCQNEAGKIAYALWHLREYNCTKRHVTIATSSFGRTERQEFRLQSAFMPAWLHHLCYFRYAPARVP